MGNQKWTIQRNGERDKEKQNTQQHNIEHYYTQANTNNVNKTGDLLYEATILFKTNNNYNTWSYISFN